MTKRKEIEFIETLCGIRGELQSVDYHIERVRRTLGMDKCCDAIKDCIEQYRGNSKLELERVTFTYNQDAIVTNVRTVDYARPTYNSYKVFEVDDSFEYALKYADRHIFMPYIEVCKDGECPILVRSNGLILDTHFTNIVLEKENKLITPSTPLLEGTRRARLLREGIITEEYIYVDDLKNSNSIHLINAMNGIGDLTILQ